MLFGTFRLSTFWTKIRSDWLFKNLLLYNLRDFDWDLNWHYSASKHRKCLNFKLTHFWKYFMKFSDYQNSDASVKVTDVAIKSSIIVSKFSLEFKVTIFNRINFHKSEAIHWDLLWRKQTCSYTENYVSKTLYVNIIDTFFGKSRFLGVCCKN